MSAEIIEEDPLEAAPRKYGRAPEPSIEFVEEDAQPPRERPLEWLRRRLLKNAHIFRSSTFIALEIAATIVALALCAAGMAWWWLSQGPQEVPVIRRHIEAELAEARDGRPVDIDRVELRWTSQLGLEIRAVDVRLLDARRRPLSASREVLIGLSPWHLLIGQVRVTRAHFVGGEVSVARKRNGATHLAFGPPGSMPDVVIAPPPANESLDQRVKRILDGFESALKPVGPGGRLREISVSGAHLVIVDEVGGGRWRADSAAFNIAREHSSLRLSARARLEGPRGPAPASLNVTTDTGFRTARIEFAARGVRPRALFSPAGMGIFAGLDAPMNATVRVGLDRRAGITQFDGDVVLGRGVAELPDGRFAIEGGRLHGAYDLANDVLTIDQIALAGARNHIRGNIRVANVQALLRKDRTGAATFAASLPSVRLDVPGVFPEAASLRNVIVAGRFNRPQSAVEFTRVQAAIGAAQLSGTGKLYWAAAANGRTHPGASFQGAITGVLDARDFVRAWPANLAAGARKYVADATLGGRITDVTIAGDIRPDDTARGMLRDEALDIRFNFTDAQFRYVATMSPLVGARGRGQMRGNRFDAWVDSGRIEGIAVSNGHVELPRIAPKGGTAMVTVRGQGDVRSVINLLRQEPIGLEGSLPIQPDTAVGRGVMTFTYQRPMLSDVPPEDQRFTVSGQFNGVGGLEKNGRITFADGRLTVRGDQNAVTVSGPLRAGASPANIEWVERLTPGTRSPSRYQISGTFDADDLQRLGYPTAGVARGRIGVAVRGEGRGHDVDNANVTLDFADATIRAPRDMWTKRPGQPATARFNVGRAAHGILVLSDIELRGPGLAANQGEVRIARDNRVLRATLPRLTIAERTDARINFERASDGALVYDISGAQFDATPWMGEDPAATPTAALVSTRNAQTRPPIRGRLRVTRLGMRGGAFLGDARAEFSVANDVLVMLAVEGRDASGGPFTLGLGPRPSDPQGRIALRAADAGFAARALTGSENVRGGTATADGVWTPGPPSRAQFTVRMRNFTAVRVPAMTRLLSSVASLRGMVEMLDGDGITFNTLEAPVTMQGSLITIGEARTAGRSLGLTATGTYDTARDDLDINGVLVPSYGLNSMLGNVPVVGNLFRSREGEGMFGITYSMEGPIANARVGANPLSALAPGIFRRIFEGSPPRQQQKQKQRNRR